VLYTVQNILLSMCRKMVDHPPCSQDHSPYVFHVFWSPQESARGQ
jgi:hypothetical protein